MVERVFELLAAATDEFLGCIEGNLVPGADVVAGFFGGLAIDANPAGEDESLGFFATLAQALFNKSLIEASHIQNRVPLAKTRF
jgi:hypothetical protein